VATPPALAVGHFRGPFGPVVRGPVRLP
jgi:hypothetical protein